MAQQLTIDAAGRLVIPAQVRRRLMIERGGVLTLTEDGGRIVLEPVVVEPETTEVDGFLVFTGPIHGPFVDIRDVREEHHDRKGRPSPA